MTSIIRMGMKPAMRRSAARGALAAGRGRGVRGDAGGARLRLDVLGEEEVVGEEGG